VCVVETRAHLRLIEVEARDVVFELCEVSVRLGRRALLDRVSLAVGQGEVLGIVGPKGAGKTTVLRVLSGELSPQLGSVRLDSRKLRGLSAAELARRCAFLSRLPSVDLGSTALDVVLLGRAFHRARESHGMARETAEQAMALAEVSELACRPYLELSNADRQQVQLARVLAQVWHPLDEGGTRLVLLDEPVAGPLFRYRDSTLARLRRFASSSIAIAIVLHDLALAAEYTDRLLMLEAGHIRAFGTTSNVLELARSRWARAGVACDASMPRSDGTRG
jgi:iron complex transport system ATP-binding protein